MVLPKLSLRKLDAAPPFNAPRNTNFNASNLGNSYLSTRLAAVGEEFESDHKCEK
jgi:hypothetical protein